MDEYQFWNNRLRNLDNIYRQLRQPHHVAIGRVLEASDSAYSASFRLIIHQTVCELAKARDTVAYLNALTAFTEIFRSTDFDKSEELIGPLVRCVCIMWAHAQHYATDDWKRLLQMISNLMIAESTSNLAGTSMFQNDVDEELMRIERNISVLDHFRCDNFQKVLYDLQKEISQF